MISLRELNDWRALTATLISKLGASSRTGKGMESSVTDCANRIMSVIGHWILPEESRALGEGLEKILFQAVKLSQTLRCQRACWSVRHLGESIAADSAHVSATAPVFFNEVTMNDMHGGADSDDDMPQHKYRKLVEIVVTPGLFKRGNTDGERFDIESCVERSEVKCRLPIVGASH